MRLASIQSIKLRRDRFVKLLKNCCRDLKKSYSIFLVNGVSEDNLHPKRGQEEFWQARKSPLRGHAGLRGPHRRTLASEKTRRKINPEIIIQAIDDCERETKMYRAGEGLLFFIKNPRVFCWSSANLSSHPGQWSNSPKPSVRGEGGRSTGLFNPTHQLVITFFLLAYWGNQA